MARLAAPAAVLAVLAVLAVACSTEPSFGRRCETAGDCGADAPVCVDARCVPARSANDAGNGCARPVPYRAPDDGDPSVLLRVASTFGALRADGPSEPCAAHDAPGVVFALTTGDDLGVRFDVAAGFPVDVEVRPLADGVCGDVVDCGRTSSTVAHLPKGDWAVIVHGTPPEGDPGSFVLTATRIDCPVGYLPYDEATCVGFRPVAPIPFTLRHPSAAMVRGRVVVVDEQPEESLKPGVQVFDPRSDRWSMVDLPADVGLAGIGTLADGDGLIVTRLSSTGALVVWRLVDRGIFDLVSVFEGRSGTDAANFTGPPAVVAADGSALVVGPGTIPYVLDPTPLYCAAQRCPVGFACVEGTDRVDALEKVCVCVTSGCADDVHLAAEPTNVPALGDGAKAIGVPGAVQGLTFVHGFADQPESEVPFAGFVDMQNFRVAGVHVAKREHVTLAAAPGVVVVAGGIAWKRPSRLVEFVDAETRAVVQVTLPVGLHRPAVAPFAGSIAVLGGCLDAECAARSSSTFFLDRASAVRPGVWPGLPMPGGDVAAAAIDDDHVLVIDGATRRTAVLERVPRGFEALAADESGACATTETRALRAGGREVEIDGSILSRLDRLRSEWCVGVGITEHPEAVYAIDLDAAADVEITLTPVDAARDQRFEVWAFGGGCAQQRHDLACAPDNGDRPALLLSAVDAGRFYVVVEAARFATTGSLTTVDDFAPFVLKLRATSASAVCLPDGDDPADDELLGARPMVMHGDVVAHAAVAEASGSLCTADVDNLLYEHGGGQLLPLLSGTTLIDTQVRRAIVDDVQSAAAGRLVLSAVEEAPNPNEELPDGAYVLTLTPRFPDVAIADVRWHLLLASDCTLDIDDSFVDALDDRNRPARPPPPGPVVHEDRSLCFAGDVDVVPLPSWNEGRTLTIELEGSFSNEFEVGVVRVAEDGRLGDRVPTTIAQEGSTTRLTAVDGPDEPTALVLGPSTAEQRRVAIAIAVSGAVGETCGNAVALSGASGEEAVTLFGRVDDVDVSEIGNCTGWPSTGPDAFHALTLAAGEGAEVTVTPLSDPADPSGPEVSLYAFVGCPPAVDACIAGSDEGYGGDAETIAIPPSDAARTVFIAVDSFDPSGFDALLTWSKTR